MKDPLAITCGDFAAAIMAMGHALPPGNFMVDLPTLPPPTAPVMRWMVPTVSGQVFGASYMFTGADAGIPLRAIAERYTDIFERFKRRNPQHFP